MTIGVDLNVPSYASLNIHSCSSDSSPRLDQAAQKTWHSTAQHVAQTHKIKNIYKRIPRLIGVKLSSHVCFVFFIINLFFKYSSQCFLHMNKSVDGGGVEANCMCTSTLVVAAFTRARLE